MVLFKVTFFFYFIFDYGYKYSTSICSTDFIVGKEKN